MKKLFTLLTTAILVAACGGKSTNTSTLKSVGSDGKHALVVGTSQLELSADFKTSVDKVKVEFASLVKKFGKDAKIATDNLAIAELLVEAEANLVALPAFSDTLLSNELKYNTQVFNSKPYSCGGYDDQEVKKEGDQLFCYINGVKNENIKPIKNAKYGPIDTKKYYNLGFYNNIDKEQLKASGAQIFMSTAEDHIETKISGIEHVNLPFFHTPEALYLIVSALEDSFAANKSFAPTYKYELYKAYNHSTTLEKDNTKKIPTIQFVILDSDNKVYGTTSQWIGNILAKRFGFESAVVGVKEPMMWSDGAYKQELTSKYVGDIIPSAAQLTGDIVVVFVASQWGLDAVQNYINDMVINDSKAYKNGNIIYLEDAQFVSKDTMNIIIEILEKVYDK